MCHVYDILQYGPYTMYHVSHKIYYALCTKYHVLCTMFHTPPPSHSLYNPNLPYAAIMTNQSA